MAFVKVLVSTLFVAVALARPQLSVDEDGETFDANPQYKYAYQVSDEGFQTYIAHEENRDGENVSGQYSYVDPLGSLITVRYTSGAMGYTETRDVQDNFVTIRALPLSSSSASSSSSSAGSAQSGAIQQVIQTVQPVVQSVVREETISSGDDSDLVARIISQLTPFIQETVSSSLSGRSGSATTTTTTQARPISVLNSQSVATSSVAAAAPVVRTVVAQPVAVAAPVRQASSSSSVEGIFGVAGQNNVRVETPNFNFAYDLAK